MIKYHADRASVVNFPSLEPVEILSILQQLHAKYKNLQDSKASYIPELVKVDPNLFSICVAIDGQVYEVGNSDRLFTIQSNSKVFVHGMVLERGRDYLLSRFGVEPTADAFNAIVLDETSKRPYNPMVNAEAIATTSLIKGTGAIA